MNNVINGKQPIICHFYRPTLCTLDQGRQTMAHRPNAAHHLLFYGPLFFFFSNDCRGWGFKIFCENYMKFKFQDVFIKLHWNIAMFICFHMSYVCFWTKMLSSYKRPYGTQSVGCFLYSLLMPALDSVDPWRSLSDVCRY